MKTLAKRRSPSLQHPFCLLFVVLSFISFSFRNVNISKTKKDLSKRKKRLSSVCWKARQISTNYISLHRHINGYFLILRFYKSLAFYRSISIYFEPCAILNYCIYCNCNLLEIEFVRRYQVCVICHHSAAGRMQCYNCCVEFQSHACIGNLENFAQC